MDDKQKQEVIDSTLKFALDIIKQRKEAGKDASPSKGNVHAIIIYEVMCETRDSIVQNKDESEEDFLKRERLTYLLAFNEVENGSALRQKAEKAGLLAKGATNTEAWN